MQMARQPTQPPQNLPQAIVDFVGLVRDTSWLKPFVEAAQATAKANALTGEEAENLADAQAIIEKAETVHDALSGMRKAIEQDKAELLKAQDAVALREKQCDDRNTHLAEEGKAVAKETDRLRMLNNKLASQQKEQELTADAQQKEQARLTAWAQELSEQEAVWDKLRGTITKKKPG